MINGFKSEYTPNVWKSYDSKWNYKSNNGLSSSNEGQGYEYPWEQDFGVNSESGTCETDETTEFKLSYWSHHYKPNDGGFKNDAYFDLVLFYQIVDMF